MESQFSLHILLTLTLIILGMTGCGKNTTDKRTSQHEAVTAGPPKTVETAHAHPSEGLHGGSLIELGNEEYHAELVHDEKVGSVTVYLLDSAAKNMIPIEAAELTVNLSHDGNAEQFTLAAKPDTGDPTGKSSRFVSTDAELAGELDHEGVKAQLVASINGKQFRGDIQHDHEGHDYEGHGH